VAAGGMSAATSVGAQSATAAGNGFGVRRGDVRGGVRPVFGMSSCWRGVADAALRLLCVAGAAVPL
jgi:hypothetical protein